MELSKKPEVDISKLHPSLVTIQSTVYHLWEAFFPEDVDGATITSGHEDIANPRVHAPTSKHYIVNNASGFGEAFDLRAHDVQQAKVTIFVGLLWTTLTVVHGDFFKIFAEGMLTGNSHIHIQLK